MENLTGKQFGPYQIVAPLGEGGMAAVYKAYQPGMERYVALKVLPRSYADDAQFLARFQREAKLLAQLQHPHILPVFDFGQAEGYTYIVMPYIQSGTLTDLLKGEPLPLARIRQIITQVGEALNYAHARGLIHRDVKPSNVLIDESGNCLLTDFGLARMVEDSVNLTSTGTIMGTPAYMSPEQGSGQKIDARSDIYSLGVVLFEMATGRVPYRAETPIAVIFKHVQDPLPPARSINPDLPEAVELVILKALSKNPEDRYQTAGDMVRAIQSAIPDSPVSTPATLIHKSADDKVPSPTVVEHGLSPTMTAKPKRGLPVWAWALIGVALLVMVAGGGFWVFGRGAVPSNSSGAGATIVITSTAAKAPLPSEVLIAVGTLHIGEKLLSLNQLYRFEFLPDGDLVLYDNYTDKPIWSSNTKGEADSLVMQDDGNLVLYSKSKSPIWSSGSVGKHGDYYLQLQDNGNLVILWGKPYSGNVVPIWATNTNR
jgi:serine/threonine protein kinase